MALTILKVLLPLSDIDSFLVDTEINSIIGMVYVEGGYLLILYT